MRKALLSTILTLTTSTAWASDCRIFQEWLDLRARQSSQVSLSARMELPIRIYDAQEAAAQDLYRLYTERKLSSGILESCVADEAAKTDFLRALSRVFYQESIERLKRSRIPPLENWIQIAEPDPDSGASTFFAAIDHRIGPHQAGFDRASHALLLDFADIPPGEWMFWFVHELAHRIDPILEKASETYNSESVASRIFSMAKRTDDPAALSKADRDLLRANLQAGLDRGLLAEHRAFAAGFMLYPLGVKAGLWDRIPWIEKLLSSCPSNQSIAAMTFRFLDPRFFDPETTGLFSHPLVQKEYRKMRSEMREATSPPPLLPTVKISAGTETRS